MAPPDNLYIRQSVIGLVMLIGGAVLFVMASAFVAVLGFVQSGFIGALLICLGVFGFLFFCLAGVVTAFRAVNLRGPVVSLTTQGIRDIRVSPDWIAWSQVQGAKTWSHQGQNFLDLHVDTAFESALKLSLLTRISRAPNRLLGLRGLPITMSGLRLGYSDFLDEFERFYDYYGS